jgi:hypothetical protein
MEEIKKFPAGAISKFMETYGGEGSGNFGHAGKKGQYGGSAPKGVKGPAGEEKVKFEKGDIVFVPKQNKEAKILYPAGANAYEVMFENRGVLVIPTKDLQMKLAAPRKSKFEVTDKHWEGVTSALKKASIPCRVKDLGDQLVVELGWDFPDSLDSKVSSIIEKVGIPYGKYSLSAESSGPGVKRSQTIGGGPRRYSRYSEGEEIENNIDTYSSIQVNFMARRKMLQGKQHMIVPVVMMVEGVHAGSHGPLFHSMKELGKFPDSWNGIPVTVGHPQIGGQNVSANSPEVIEQTVGKVFNTRVENNKLKAEVWLDEQRLQSISPETMAFIQKGNNLEVSIGVFTDEELVNGEWNGEIYKAIAKNHRPDHLALLPGERGACSWADGCGVRVNKFKKEEDEDEEEMEDQETEEKDEETKETPLKKAVKKFNFKNYVTKE